MISKVRLQNFKRFRDETFEFEPTGLTVVAGGNNSGKSSILHALAMWEYCRRRIETQHGRTALERVVPTATLSTALSHFTPLSIPSFQHLWTNLGSQRTTNPILIGVTWKDPAHAGVEQNLEFRIDLPANLRVRVSATSVIAGASIPKVAYLPPFAGIRMKEHKLSVLERERLIGQGIPGAVIRNHVCALHEQSRLTLDGLKNARGRVSTAARANFLRTDPWRQLLEVMNQEFQCMVYPAERSASAGSQVDLTVNLTKGTYVNGRFRKFPRYVARDIAVEGSGFLQWLSVFALAVDAEHDVLLFDEADVHLHSTFQNKILFRLNREANDKGKQILFVTHSTEILRDADYRRIYAVEEGRKGYLAEESGKVRVINGLGSLYAPRVEKLFRTKKLLILEGTSDEALLNIWAQTLGVVWPDNVVIWFSTGKQSERKNLFLELNKEVRGIKAISLRDRDEEAWNTTQPDLRDRSFSDFIGATPADGAMYCRKWRRRSIENYLLLPDAIARAAPVPISDVTQFLNDQHSVTINNTFGLSDCHVAIADYRAKDITYSGPNNTEGRFGVSRHAIAGAMTAAEVCDDIRTFIQELTAFAAI